MTNQVTHNGLRLVLAALACWTVGIGRAAALPAPLPQDELERQSDLIVEVDVLSVAKTGRRDAPIWRARLHVRKTIKGPAPASDMTYEFIPPQAGLAGEVNGAVFAGERLRMYLILEEGKPVAWASNSIGQLTHFPEARRILPAQHGEIIDACGRTSRPR